SRLDPASSAARVTAPLLNAVIAVKAGKPGPALKALDAILLADPKNRIALMLRPYVLAMNGQWQPALAASVAADSNDDRALGFMLQAERAEILELKGQDKDAEDVYKSLQQQGFASVFGADQARFLERQGRKDDARAVWTEVVSRTNDAAAVQALARLDAPNYAKPARPDLRQSMSQTLFMAANIASGERDLGQALTALRLSLYLDGGSDRARILLGQIEQQIGDQDAAEATWNSIPATSPYASDTSLNLVMSLRAREDEASALSVADTALARDPDNLSLLMEKVNILHERADDQAALTLITDRIARAGDKDFTWQAWFVEAMIYDNLDRWDDAEAAINKARALNDSRPEILNFLGYGWINRGLHVKEGMDLVRQAMAANPKSGAIVDSLGWGYYKLGDYEQALTYVEQAVQLSPSDAEINEHLGDVYKALGRDTEAGYEWQRVLALQVSDKVAAEVRQKLEANAAALKIAVAPDAKATTTALNDGKAQGGQD
ncbi:MAG: tetratricopeptide repeat protein, partial [Asticcacaulis sp.]|nr:tetratricopeptide repeat protein [Asticcacaulis sp.]